MSKTTVEKLIQIAENEQKVYGAGIERGIEQGISEVSHLNDELEQILYGTDTGGKSFYDEFWDGVFKVNHWQGKFYGSSWNDDTFYPDRDIRPVTNHANSMFALCQITDLAGRLRECGVVLDLTGVTTRVDNLFNYAQSLTTVPYIDLRNSTYAKVLTGSFDQCIKLVTIEGIHIKEDGSQGLDASGGSASAFRGCSSLENIKFYGTIGDNLNFQWSKKLSKASILNILDALSTTTDDLTVTFSKAAVDAAFETSPGANNGSSSQEWGIWEIGMPPTGRANWIFDLV